MKVRRILVLLLTVLTLLGGATAADGQGFAAAAHRGSLASGGSERPAESTPKVGTIPAVHGSVIAPTGNARRTAVSLPRARALCPVSVFLAEPGSRSRVDLGADAHRPHGTSTPCSGRGPPRAA